MHEAGATSERGASVRGHRHPDQALSHPRAGRRRGHVRLHHEVSAWEPSAGGLRGALWRGSVRVESVQGPGLWRERLCLGCGVNSMFFRIFPRHFFLISISCDCFFSLSIYFSIVNACDFILARKVHYFFSPPLSGSYL